MPRHHGQTLVNQRQNLESSQKEQHITYRGRTARVTVDSSSEAMEAQLSTTYSVYSKTTH